MEAVHKPAKRAWIDETVIDVKQLLTKCLQLVPLDESTSCVRSLEKIVSEEEFFDIEEQCGQDVQKCPFQEFVECSKTIFVPKFVNLKTISEHAEDLEKRLASPKYSAVVYHHFKFHSYPPHQIFSYLTDISKIPHKPVAYPDVVLSVQVFLPERRLEPNTVTTTCNKMPSFQLDQEFLVLGNQYLTELRDKISCISDKAIPYESSDCPTEEPTITCKDLYKSGFFYINGVFYNDMRDKDCRDYSETILNWASKGNRGIGPFKKALMEKTTFVDLSIQLGYPYVYTHQGDCEHLLVFSDLRLLSKHDVDNRNAYPLYVQCKHTKRFFCGVCHEYTASWVVYENKRLPESPFFFCKTCFISFNYDKDDQKIGDFKAFHFPDNTKL